MPWYIARPDSARGDMEFLTEQDSWGTIAAGVCFEDEAAADDHLSFASERIDTYGARVNNFSHHSA